MLYEVITWLTYRVTGNVAGHEGEQERQAETRLYPWFNLLVGAFLRGKNARTRRRALAVAVLVLIAISLSLVMFKAVVLKMLPFDNKSEFQVVVDMPEA